MVTINRKVRQFKDLDLNFIMHPSTHDVVKSYDEDSINKNLRYLILTINYERPFHPEKGCQINSLLFDFADPLMVQIMKRTIEEAISNFEPRVNLVDVRINSRPENNDIEVSIEYIIVNTSQPVIFTTILTRTR